MANQCVDMVEAYLDQLREEGCKLIQWSDDLKHQLPPNSVTPPNSGTSPCSKGLTSPAGHQNSLSPFPNPAVGSSSPMQADLSFPGGSNTPAHSVRNFNQFQLNSLDTSQLAKEFPHLSGNGDAHRLLMILYNNYRFVLKKYEELNEQKLSYIEGLREYQYKLDNSNYLIQLQRSQLSSLTNLAPTYSDLASNSGAVAAGWLNKEHNLLNRERELLRLKEEDLKSREEELSSKEQDLRSKEEDLTSRESNLASREEALAAKQLEVSGKEHELFSMQDSLSSMEQELTSKRESLAERESNLAAKEAELFQREALLSKNEGLLSEGQELLKSRHDPLIASDLPQGNKPSYVPGRDKSIFVEERGQVAFTASRPNANHGHTDISNSNSGPTHISNATHGNTDATDKGVQSTAAAAANTLEDEEIDNEAINSTYIQNMNANNDDMYVLKKNLFHKVVLKSCSLRIEDNSLIFRIKSNPFKLPLKEITRLHFGEESHSYQIHNKGRAGGTKASCYFTIYTQSNKNINMYCDNEHNIRAWRNGLNRVLLKQNAENILAGDAPTVPAANAPPSNADHDATAAEHTNRGAQGTVD